MLFNSYEFIFGLLPVSLAGYFLIGRRSPAAAIWWLVLVSIFFYGWWQPAHLPIFIGSILGNFCCAALLRSAPNPARSRTVLIGGVVFNLGLLAVFKYGDFFIENLNALSGVQLPLLHLALPLGISFFTFTQLAYLADIRRQRQTSHPLGTYSLFVSFFPHLLAGPILHHQEMLPQFADEQNKRPNAGHLGRGACLFALGLAKKVLLADPLVPYVRFGFDTAPSLDFVEAWLTTLAYCLQIYFDFSGYTDMAIGAALLFNIRLPFNFDSPYRALDILSFWRRWHITLGRFFRDYVYIPLGGNRLNLTRTFTNLFAVALISGLWHGAAWQFVLWGALHGLAMVICLAWQRRGRPLFRPLAWLLAFGFLNVSWVFFRAPDLERVGVVLRGMCGLNGITLFSQLAGPLSSLKALGVKFHPLAIQEVELLLAYLAVGMAIALWPRNSNRLLDETRQPSLLQVAILAVLGAVSILHLGQLSEFIYFNF